MRTEKSRENDLFFFNFFFKLDPHKCCKNIFFNQHKTIARSFNFKTKTHISTDSSDVKSKKRKREMKNNNISSTKYQQSSSLHLTNGSKWLSWRQAYGANEWKYENIKRTAKWNNETRETTMKIQAKNNMNSNKLSYFKRGNSRLTASFHNDSSDFNFFFSLSLFLTFNFARSAHSKYNWKIFIVFIFHFLLKFVMNRTEMKRPRKRKKWKYFISIASRFF